MSWAKLAGNFTFHPKVVAAGNEAIGAWVRMLSYAAEHLTDGKISFAIVCHLATPETIERLVSVRMLDPVDDGYRLHNFGNYNPTGPDLQKHRAELSAKRAEAGRRGASAKWQNGKRDSKGDGKLPSKADGKTWQNGWQKDGPSPSPSPSPEERDPLPPAQFAQDSKGVPASALVRAEDLVLLEPEIERRRAKQLTELAALASDPTFANGARS